VHSILHPYFSLNWPANSFSFPTHFW
jgi:hypothetical protein